MTLVLLTLACLLPFCNKAFFADDSLFIWAAKQIAAHPGDPYGFLVHWYTSPMPMAAVTKNPPVAAYLAAAIGSIAGWSELALHLGFLLPAIAAILGTFQLATRLTSRPWLAAAATLLTPGFLVSSTSVMCDVLMLACWMWAASLWLDGLDRRDARRLAGAAVLIAAAALTKYFGIALVPLLFAYAVVRERRVGSWALYFLVPLAAIGAYDWWTHALYHQALFTEAAAYHPHDQSIIAGAVTTLSFAGGCALTALTFAPLLWRRAGLAAGGAAGAVVGGLCAAGVIDIATLAKAPDLQGWICTELAAFVAGALSIIALAVTDWRAHRNAPSLLLGLWIAGTLVFTAGVNWSVNARSVLPLIPAAAILLARRIDHLAPRSKTVRLLPASGWAALAVAGIVSVWAAAGDMSVANSERRAAEGFAARYPASSGQVNFTGHWGFQYYMQSLGFQPVDFSGALLPGRTIIIPENNANGMMSAFPPAAIAGREDVEIEADAGIATMRSARGAGFYADVFGPIPYSFGPVPPERYAILHLREAASAGR